MAQLIPLPLTVSCFSKIQIGLPFWYRLTQVVPDKGPLNGCVCAVILDMLVTVIDNQTLAYFYTGIFLFRRPPRMQCATATIAAKRMQCATATIAANIHVAAWLVDWSFIGHTGHFWIKGKNQYAAWQQTRLSLFLNWVDNRLGFRD